MPFQDEFLFFSKPQVDREKKWTENELVKEMKYDRKLTLEDGKGLGLRWALDGVDQLDRGQRNT